MADKNWQADVRQGDYEEIEEAVLETARGRWFLAEFARRNRNADTRMLLDAMGRLEKVVANRLEGVGASLPAADIERTRADIAALRQENLDDGGALPAGADPFAATATAAAALAEGIAEASAALQELAASLRERHPDEPAVDRLDAAIGKLHRQGWLSDLTGRRIGLAMALLARARTDSRPHPMLEPRNLKFFAADEELFQPIAVSGKPRMAATVEAIASSETFHFHTEKQPAAQPDAAEAKKRIVVVRRPAEESDIPLGTEEAGQSTAG